MKIEFTQAISLTNPKPFKPTEKDCVEWFQILNENLFDKKLVQPYMIIKKLRKTYGRHNMSNSGNPEDALIELSYKFPNKIIFVEVLAHEMVHQYQDQFDEPYGHGKYFLKWKDHFKQFGLKLRVAI